MAAENPKFSNQHEDPRGALYQLLVPTGEEILLFFSKAGSFRGGHSHDKDEIVLVISGKFRYHKLALDGAKTEEIVSTGAVSWNLKGQAHMGEFLEDTWLLEWKPGVKAGDWTTTNYEPFRARVRESLRDGN